MRCGLVQGHEIAIDRAKNGGKQVEQRQCGVWWISILVSVFGG